MSLVVENSQRAEALVKVFESKLYEEDAVNCDLKSIETVISTLKVRPYLSVFSICFIRLRKAKILQLKAKVYYSDSVIHNPTP